MSRRSQKRWILRAALVAPLLVLAIIVLPRPAPATIQEQRNRLPPPADCGDDPVTGIWKSHAYYPHHGQWYIFTLTIHRQPDSDRALVGNVHSHYWVGGPQDQEPPPCRAGGYHQTVIMPGNGTVDGMNIEFGGTSWEVEQTFCGSPTVSYYPDRFSGVIDPSIEEFQSVNNDGGPMVNYPTVFRRIRCLEDPESPPPVVVAPPEFYPSDGCNCSLF